MANYEAWTRLGGCLTGVRCGVWHLTRLLAHWCRVWAFFFFTYSRWLGSICANLASICAEPGWFGQNQAVLAESSCFGQRPKRPKQAEISLESEIGFEWGPNNLNLSFLNFILNIFLLLLCFMFFAFFFLCFVNQGIVMCFLRIF